MFASKDFQVAPEVCDVLGSTLRNKSLFKSLSISMWSTPELKGQQMLKPAAEFYPDS